jgi:hypothetical protein
VISPIHDLGDVEVLNISTPEKVTPSNTENLSETVTVSFEFESSQRGAQLGTQVINSNGLGLNASTNKSSIAASIVNLSNTIVGSGMLALPFALASCGYVLGFFFLVLFGCLSSLGLHLLSSCALKVGCSLSLSPPPASPFLLLLEREKETCLLNPPSTTSAKFNSKYIICY